MTTRVELIDDKEITKKISDFINENSELVAKDIASKARASTAFKDKTGYLRRSIKAKKSKYDTGGWIVKANAPHAWIIEHGRKGQQARPFLRPALSSSINYFKSLTGAV